MNYTTEEIIKSLRICSKDDLCEGCVLEGTVGSLGCYGKLLSVAADMLEDLATRPSTCGDCAKYDECKPYVDKSETFPETGGCPAYKPTVKVMLDEGARMPTRAHPTDAGLDIYAPASAYIRGRDSVTFDTGVHIAIPEGYVGLLMSKSGLNVKHGITSEGVIDAGYTGSICVKLYNNSNKDYIVEEGDKISQLVIVPVLLAEPIRVDKLEDTERGDNGFGSTGR